MLGSNARSREAPEVPAHMPWARRAPRSPVPGGHLHTLNGKSFVPAKLSLPGQVQILVVWKLEIKSY